METSSWLWVINISKLALRCFENLHISLTSINICWSWSVPRAAQGMRAPCGFLWWDLEPFEGLEHPARISPWLSCEACQVPSAQNLRGMEKQQPSASPGRSLIILIHLGFCCRSVWGNAGCSLPTSRGERGHAPRQWGSSWWALHPWGPVPGPEQPKSWASKAAQAAPCLFNSLNTAQKSLAGKTQTWCLLPTVSFT